MAENQEEQIRERIGKKPPVEIRTMKKDVARLRLLESEEERKKIVTMQSGETPLEEQRERTQIEFKKREESFGEKVRKIGLFSRLKKEGSSLEPKIVSRPKPTIRASEEGGPSSPVFFRRKPFSEKASPDLESETFKPTETFGAKISQAPQEQKKALPPLFFQTLEQEGVAEEKAKIVFPPRSQPKPQPIPQPRPKLQPQPQTQAKPLPPEPTLVSVSSALEGRDLEKRRVELLKKKSEIGKILSLIKSEEESVETKIHLIEEEENTTDTEDRQAIEKTRRHLEKKRNETEERRWKEERELATMEKELKELDLNLDRLKLKENAGFGEAAETLPKQKKNERPGQQLPQGSPKKKIWPFGKTTAPQAITPSAKTQTQAAAPSFNPAPASPLSQPTQKLGGDERLAEAKRRLELLREDEKKSLLEQDPKIEKEMDAFRQRLKENEKKPPFLKKKVSSPEEAEEMFEGRVEVLRPLPQKPSTKQRQRRRLISFVLIVLPLILGVAGLSYWFLKYAKATDFKMLIVRLTHKETGNQQNQEITPPEALIAVSETKVIEISSEENLNDVLTLALKENFSSNQFTRIVFRNKGETTFLGLADFLNNLGVIVPSEIKENLEKDFTLFVYPLSNPLFSTTTNKNRLGLIAKIKEGKNLSDPLLLWEVTMESDTEKFFLALGKTEPITGRTFEQTTYKGAIFRYLSFPQEDFGICWAIVNNYFVFSSSGEATIKVIDKIKTSANQ